jgi:hypothetical protein
LWLQNLIEVFKVFFLREIRVLILICSKNLLQTMHKREGLLNEEKVIQFTIRRGPNRFTVHARFLIRKSESGQNLIFRKSEATSGFRRGIAVGACPLECGGAAPLRNGKKTLKKYAGGHQRLRSLDQCP